LLNFADMWIANAPPIFVVDVHDPDFYVFFSCFFAGSFLGLNLFVVLCGFYIHKGDSGLIVYFCGGTGVISRTTCWRAVGSRRWEG
jgi:hypothetical protein